MKHRWSEPAAAGTDSKGRDWTGYVCVRCGIVAKRTKAKVVLAWARAFLAPWKAAPIPACTPKEKN